MKEGSVRLSQAGSIPRAILAGSWIRLTSLSLVAMLLLLAIGCPTPIPRPGNATTETPSPTQVPTVSPTTTAVATPIPTRRLKPTVTAVPSPRPTVVPGPVEPTATTEPTPVPTDNSQGLMLQVYAPEEGATVPGATVVVYGQTLPGARVFITGEETEVDAEGGFRADISLMPAENEVVIVAQHDDGRLHRVTRKVTSLALPFLLLVTEPENESIVSAAALPLSGRTGPNAILSVNGRSIPVDRFGYFSSSVQLDEGPNVIDVVATNDDGRTLSTVLAVIYRAPRN